MPRAPSPVAHPSGYRAAVTSPDWAVHESADRLTYAEGDQALAFPRVPSERQPVVLVPDATIWDAVLPTWLRGRRAEVVERLTSGPFVTEETDAADWTAEVARLG